MNCEDCKYGVRKSENEISCRRYPPQVLPGFPYAYWPVVFPTHWCGEYADRPGDDMPMTGSKPKKRPKHPAGSRN
jgi:hypothetical protein